MQLKWLFYIFYQFKKKKNGDCELTASELGTIPNFWKLISSQLSIKSFESKFQAVVWCLDYTLRWLNAIKMMIFNCFWISFESTDGRRCETGVRAASRRGNSEWSAGYAGNVMICLISFLSSTFPTRNRFLKRVNRLSREGGRGRNNNSNNNNINNNIKRNKRNKRKRRREQSKQQPINIRNK